MEGRGGEGRGGEGGEGRSLSSATSSESASTSTHLSMMMLELCTNGRTGDAFFELTFELLELKKTTLEAVSKTLSCECVCVCVCVHMCVYA